MPIYKPSELRLFLEQLGIRPSKRLSQNFLIDGNILKKIVAAAVMSSNDLILEVGPGPGALTEQLLQAGATVVAVEKDTVLASALKERIDSEKLFVHEGDILEIALEETLKTYLPPEKKGKVIANLPYSITTATLERLAPMRHLFSSIVVMVQEEVARRFTTKPGDSSYGVFNIFLNFYATPHYAFHVSKNCFYPVPKVNSAILILDLKEPPLLQHTEAFFLLVHTAFEHRRKALRSSLADLYPADLIAAALSQIGIDPLVRPEQLSVDQFVAIFKRLNKYN